MEWPVATTFYLTFCLWRYNVGMLNFQLSNVDHFRALDDAVSIELFREPVLMNKWLIIQELRRLENYRKY